MERHYRRVRGYRRNPGRGGRPVYYMPMDKREVRERRFLYGAIGTMAALVCTVIVWVVITA